MQHSDTQEARIRALQQNLNAATDMLRELVTLLDRHLPAEGRAALHERLLSLRRMDRQDGRKTGSLAHLAENLLASLPPEAPALPDGSDPPYC